MQINNNIHFLHREINLIVNRISSACQGDDNLSMVLIASC